MRRTIVTAIAADDVLMEHLVLKGGNALEIAWGISARASLDLDFSMEGEGPEPADLEKRLLGSLRDRFNGTGHVLFDECLTPKVTVPGPEATVLGYEVRFKLVDRARLKTLHGDLRQLRQAALDVAGRPGSGKSFVIEISKNEYCEHKTVVDVDDFRVHVYTPAMIAVEKLRALCQQIPSLELRKHPCERARDFFDIHGIVETLRLDLTTPNDLALVEPTFAAKRVPVAALALLRDQREFHRPGWPAVCNALRVEPQPFDFYFEYVCRQASSLLEALGNVDSPASVVASI